MWYFNVLYCHLDYHCANHAAKPQVIKHHLYTAIYHTGQVMNIYYASAVSNRPSNTLAVALF